MVAEPGTISYSGKKRASGLFKQAFIGGSQGIKEWALW